MTKVKASVELRKLMWRKDLRSLNSFSTEKKAMEASKAS